MHVAAHNDSTIRISAVGQITIRETAQALRKSGLVPTISWPERALFLRRSDLRKACAALKKYAPTIDQELVEQKKREDEGEAQVAKRKRIILQLSDPSVARQILGDFEGITHLDEHQLSAVAIASHPDIAGFCLFDEQGLGKTISTLFAFDRLRAQGLIANMLVICPKNMVMEWERDVGRFFHGQYVCQTVVGSAREKRRALDREADIYVTNFETARTQFFRVKELIGSRPNKFLLVIDESFYVKNTTALRTNAIRRLRHFAERCMVLCGTPAPNSPTDIIEQVNIADGGAAFRGATVLNDHEPLMPVVRDLLERRAPYLRRLKRDALPTLPCKSFEQVLVPMSPVQSDLYGQALDGFIHDLEKVTDSGFSRAFVSFMAKRTRLLQLCSNPVGLSRNYDEIPGKLLALDSLLDELVSNRREKVVVWCYFTASLEAILKRYRHFNPVRLDGKVASSSSRREAVSRFQQDDSTMLFVGNVAAAGAGLTLHRARYAVYESLSNQGAHYFQSIDRIHRRGQTRPVEYIALLCDGSIEVAEYEKLSQKEQMASALLRDRDPQPPTRITMLAEARDAASLLAR